MKPVFKQLTSVLAAMAVFGGAHFAQPAMASSGAGGQVLTFGIVPQQSASRLAKMWGPFLAELSAQTGVTFRFRTTKDIPTFEACLASGAFDVAYMNPMHYTIFSSEASYTAIAHQSDKRLKGVLVARADASFEDLEGLQGGTVAFPSPGAFGASILNRALLAENGVEFDPAYVKSHDSVYRAVAAGLMVAGGGVTRTFNAVDPEIRAQLQIIQETPGYTPHAIAVHGAVDAQLRDGIQGALMTIAEAQPTLVTGIGMKGFVAAGDSAWDDVRSLEMSRDETGISRKGDAVCPSD
ncbi:phosphate/phosphite/phosphonate ABC transporters, periplasmic binding protein [Tritonibacter multivorans]|uniref:Phosphate/phosphite/phosphonate ABC transporters, periplasmic binding protein n=1 Tax=Tritonibacter multivorans TaxID=928856 RepID=A0A0P1G8V3_9RHOB|nr:phosphate/phosphite/phosphonate ABC transporter substrate-binding protein [Tritonibacter multivorans]MDA7421719.1 phosphate/phosphite/phosphonate ABC transporter substrate-binding protein [Tritonibacter multivorans]CUH78035.1 phosphate/phosphite/phosphonate ABC transporters, periplasmic binding protein [Tritonibacter multivorans]SFD03735.1 phosphonate transport system substrate-binding protein [Tritonibacter multivorans]